MPDTNAIPAIDLGPYLAGEPGALDFGSPVKSRQGQRTRRQRSRRSEPRSSTARAAEFQRSGHLDEVDVGVAEPILGDFGSRSSARGCRPSLMVMFGDTRQFEPALHRLLENCGGRQQIEVIEGAAGHPAKRRVALAFPAQITAAGRTEIEPDPRSAVGAALVDLVFALEPHLRASIGDPKMKGGAGAVLAGLAVTHIDALGLARRDDLQRAALPLANSLGDAIPDWHCPRFAHRDLPLVCSRRQGWAVHPPTGRNPAPTGASGSTHGRSVAMRARP